MRAVDTARCAPRGAIAAVLLTAGLVAGPGASAHGPATPGPAAAAAAARSSPTAAKVTIKNMAFAPRTITVRVGGTVTWTNRDAVRHTATSTKAGGPKSPLLKVGQRYRWKAAKAGTFAYHCTVHPSMTGRVVVKRH